jgi:hypothetical protein
VGAFAEPAVRLAITLRILHGASYHDLVMFYKISTATAYNIFHDFVDAIVRTIPMNSLQDAIRDGKKMTELPLLYLIYFFSISRSIPSTLSRVLGALDGIAVKVNKPSGENIQRNYWYLKGYHAIPIQAIVDSDYKFTYMSATAVGSTYDSGIFFVSPGHRA